LECVFDKFPKYHMKILLGGFKAKGGKEDILDRQLGIKIYTKLVITIDLE
jgi:hypothetical protein